MIKIIFKVHKIMCHCKCAITEWMVTPTSGAVIHSPKECTGMWTTQQTTWPRTIQTPLTAATVDSVSAQTTEWIAVLDCTKLPCYHPFTNGTLAVTNYLRHFKLWFLSLSFEVLDWLWHFKNGTILKLFIFCIASLKMAKWVAETCRRLLYIQIFH